MKSLVKKAITQATVRVYYGWSGNRQTWTDLKFWDTSWRVNVRGKYLKISFLFGRLRTALSHLRWSLVCFWFYAWRGYPRRRQFHVSTLLFSIFVVKIRDRTQNKLVAIHGGHNRVGFHLKILSQLVLSFRMAYRRTNNSLKTAAVLDNNTEEFFIQLVVFIEIIKYATYHNQE